ncbi:uncharacterized protein BDR25DRAFT_86606 [Lindgomyces ingoldianus]|uniref:Uncharacterized protein n=1 Tax=Lindgomyces ingoldianus TaxID=673940 RepID=A0ACB6QFM8_9PLEO|nr:uncharacterized protein BDR25DRAFT_86606 [Lindgomyces ingoldianus]KAF2465383.1 hypothetical protein BDR25DRAFT_86606 [Lindgomyces ingoldianus]
MSFGFSIGDFITLLDKAHLVYRKCKSAPSDYAVLAQHVEILTHVLEETRSILSPSLASSLPKPKLNSLVSARESCQITLDEVEKFLNKYEDMGKKHPTYFKRVKFIGKDVEGLKARLSLSTNLLQLGLSSLSRYIKLLFLLHCRQIKYNSS